MSSRGARDRNRAERRPPNSAGKLGDTAALGRSRGRAAMSAAPRDLALANGSHNLTLGRHHASMMAEAYSP